MSLNIFLSNILVIKDSCEKWLGPLPLQGSVLQHIYLGTVSNPTAGLEAASWSDL